MTQPRSDRIEGRTATVVTIGCDVCPTPAKLRTRGLSGMLACGVLIQKSGLPFRASEAAAMVINGEPFVIADPQVRVNIDEANCGGTCDRREEIESAATEVVATWNASGVTDITRL